jgi:hypothetical protein
VESWSQRAGEASWLKKLARKRYSTVTVGSPEMAEAISAGSSQWLHESLAGARRSERNRWQMRALKEESRLSVGFSRRILANLTGGELAARSCVAPQMHKAPRNRLHNGFLFRLYQSPTQIRTVVDRDP